MSSHKVDARAMVLDVGASPGDGPPSDPAVPGSREELIVELARERRLRQLAVAEAATQRRFAQAFARLATLSPAEASLDELARTILAALVEAARADMGTLGLEEEGRLRVRAAFAVDEQAALAARAPLPAPGPAEVAAGGHSVLVAPGADDAVAELLREHGAATPLCLLLRDGDRGDRGDHILGALHLGWSRSAPPSPDDEHLLGALADAAAAAVRRVTALEELRVAISARDEVLGIVVHDLRNPISVISMTANGILKRPADPRTQRSVERMYRAAQRADRLLTDLLDINAIDGGRFSIEKQQLETADLILDALESQQGLAATASVIIASDLSPDLPPLEGDEQRLLEVLENLIGNATKFTAPGGSVVVGASARGGEIVFAVKDSGIGIPPEQLPRIFDRFWQARRTDRRGAGLGLAICKAIVEAHGGRIWADSTLGLGTTMSFTIPAASGQGSRAAAAGVASILIVDDRPENLLSLTSILERPSYRVVTASSGEEALRLALREPFSVALIDVAMPGMSGLEVAVHLKQLERSRDIPIIFITAFGDDPEEIHRAYAAGGADYLVKPLDVDVVRKKVAVFVDLTRRRRGGGQPASFDR